MSDGFGLGVHPAADYLDHYSEPVDGIAGPERLDDDVTPGFVVEILFDGLTVDDEGPIVIVQVYPDLGDRGFSF